MQNPHPIRLYLDFIFEHATVPGAIISLDIETEPSPEFAADFEKRKFLHSDISPEHFATALKFGFVPSGPPDQVFFESGQSVPYPEFLENCKRAGLTPPKVFENSDALNPAKLNIGSIQLMDSVGQFICMEGNEAEMLKNLWEIFPSNQSWPAILTYNGTSFDLPVLEARSRFLANQGVRFPERMMTGSKWGERGGVKHLDLAEALSAGGRSMMKLDHVARAMGLPGKPEHLAKEAVEYLKSDDPAKRARALDYAEFDVLSPLQIGFQSGLIYDRLHRGIWDKSWGKKDRDFSTPAPFIFDSDKVARVTPMKEELPSHHLQLLKVIGCSQAHQNRVLNTPIETIPNIEPKVREVLIRMKESHTLPNLFNQPFGQTALKIATTFEPDSEIKTETLKPLIDPSVGSEPGRRVFRVGEGAQL